MIYFSYFLCHCLVFFHNSCVRVGSPWLFCNCIYTKTFSKHNFRMHYSIRIRNNILYYNDFSQLFIVKNENMSFHVNITFAIILFRSYIAKTWLKIILRKNKLMQKFRRPWSMGKCENSSTQLLASEYQQQSLGGVLWEKCFWKFCKILRKTPMLRSRFHLDNLLLILLKILFLTLSMYLFAEKGREKQMLLFESL